MLKEEGSTPAGRRLAPLSGRGRQLVKHGTPLRARRTGAPVLAAIATMTWVALSGTGVAAASGAPPQQSGTVKVGATITGSGVDPSVECTWALPDNDHAGGGESQQFSDAVGANIGPAPEACLTPTLPSRRTATARRDLAPMPPHMEVRLIPGSRSCTARTTTRLFTRPRPHAT